MIHFHASPLKFTIQLYNMCRAPIPKVHQVIHVSACLSTMYCMQTTQSIAKKELSSFFHQRVVNFTNVFLKSCRHEHMKAKNSNKVSQIMFCFFAQACHGLVEEQKWQICPPCSSAKTWYYNTMQLSTRQSELGCSVRYSVRPTARLD